MYLLMVFCGFLCHFESVCWWVLMYGYVCICHSAHALKFKCHCMSGVTVSTCQRTFRSVCARARHYMLSVA